ncbi:MAG TPA: hypothetical protein VN980_04910 [Alphaproteobacteria bacterium]|nr:hypothetical protein [Alphaproteobacteria bacterium]
MKTISLKHLVAKLVMALGVSVGVLLTAACSGGANQTDTSHAYWTDSYNPAHESNGLLVCGYLAPCP